MELKTEMMSGRKRTRYCGEFRSQHIGEKANVFGWVQRQRDLGQLIFIDLRDRTGILQLAFDSSTDREIFEKASMIRSEFVLEAYGTVRERSSKNTEIPTGEIELEIEELRILGLSETPPFEITDDTKAKEELRLRYRYLDLRRPELQKSIITRNRISNVTRDFFNSEGFIEIETPMLMKETPEGARDFLVPSRLHQGEFYALPQSPQLYKQLSMVAGFDRYFQLARCFRDEDLRADRQPEFTQIDIEMSFVDVDDVLDIGERYMKKLFGEILGKDIKTPLRRMTYKEAQEKYGSDKPDTRYGMEIIDLSDTVKESGFSVFRSAIESGGSVRAIVAENSASVLSRKELDRLTEYAKGIGAKGLAYIKPSENETACSFHKFVSPDEINAIIEKTGAKNGDTVLIIADQNNSHVLTQLGSLRILLARKLNIIPENRYDLLWIVEFPFFEFDEESGTWVAMHHPFTAPLDECIPYLETDKSKVRAKCYDLVLNGTELCSGSIRITNPDLQDRIFKLLGLNEEEAQQKFGFLMEAFKYGAPPHGGMALGLDRIAMILCGKDNLRDVVAYPKVQNMSELMTMSPSPIEDKQLEELGICLRQKNTEGKAE